MGTARFAFRKAELSAPRNVHSLVLEAFVGPRPPGAEACHNNGDAGDNRVSNLRWDTHRSNMRDMSAHGTSHWARRTHCPRQHPIEGTNLIASEAVHGRRACKACGRARSYARKAGIEFTQELADSYYRDLSLTVL